MIPRLSESLLLCPDDVNPSSKEFKVIGVFNPGVIRVQDEVVLLVRVAEKPLEQRPGFVGLPRWAVGGDCVVDWAADQDLRVVDPRVVATKSDDLKRLTSVSHLRVFVGTESDSKAWSPGAMFLPDSEIEEFGVEDPRITKIDQTYWITYVAVSRHGAGTALASSDDMLTFRRHGLIFCPENKDVVLFPQRINGEFVALHRPNPNSHFSPPGIWLARSPDLIHWGKHQCVHRGHSAWERDRVGGAAPPILVDEGWLHLFHGSGRSPAAGQVGQYAAGALLLDREDPSRVLARSVEAIMCPEAAFETEGFVPNVIFPTAMIDRGEELHVYYGAADTCVGVVKFAKRALMDALCWN